LRHKMLYRILRWFRYVRELESECDRLEDQLTKALAGEITLESLVARNGGMTAKFRTQVATIMAEAFHGILKEYDAENYVEMAYTTKDGEKGTVRVQRCNGKTPDELKQAAEQRLATLAAMTADDVAWDDVLAVEDEAGIGRTAWDGLDLRELISAAVRVIAQKQKFE
jgi:hypothetical protein